MARKQAEQHVAQVKAKADGIEKIELQLQHMMAQNITPCWECHVNGHWVAYDTHVASQLEAAYQSGSTSHVPFQRDGFAYVVDIQAKQQINTKTGACRSTRRVLLNPDREAHIEHKGVPEHWAPQSTGQNCDLVQCLPDSTEWNFVQASLYQTMPDATMIQLHPIQNVSLWNFYSEHRHNMQQLLGKVPHEEEVWHGTAAAKPEAIYKDIQDGFMMQKSSESNMWGKGIYFAKNASYSNNYAHHTGMSKQLLFVRLLVGDAIEMNSDKTLKHPPTKQDGSELRFDTVMGKTRGSRVFVVYENKRAYPLYRVTYRE